MIENKKKLWKTEIFGILLGLLFLSPFYIIIINALKSKKNLLIDTIGLPTEFVFSNFPMAAKKMSFLLAFTNSMIITAGSLFIIVFAAAMAGWVLCRTNSKASKIVFYIFVAAMLIPFQAVMLPLTVIMGKMHMLNSRIGIMFMYLGFGCSFAIFLYHGFIKSIPRELEEAAIIDGCTQFQVFWHIVFPLLRPISVTIAVLNSIWIWNDYLLPSLMLQKKSARTIPLQLSYFFGQFAADWHYALAALVLAIVPVIIFYFFMQRFIIKGVTSGGVKF